MNTLNEFFASDERIELGNHLIKILDELGYSFTDSRRVTRGELKAPQRIAADVARLLEMKAEHQEDLELLATLPKSKPGSPAWGDFEGTGHQEDDFWG